MPSVVLTCGSTAITVNLDMSPVRTTSGPPKKGNTGSSISECVRTKFRFSLGSDFESFVQIPGRGEGTW